MSSMKLLKAINNIDDKYILEAMPSQYKEETKSFFNIKMLASLMCVLLLGVIGVNVIKTINNNAKTNETSTIMVTNPFADYDSLYDAQSAVGFDFNVPSLDYKQTYVVIDSSIIEVDYLKDNEKIFTLRKAYGDEDISGVNPEYEGTELITINNVEVMTYSEEDGTLIRFRKDGYFYSIYSSDTNIKEQAIEIATYIIENN